MASEGFRRLLGLDGTSEYVSAYLARTNRDVLRYESIFITMVSVLVLVSTFLPLPLWTARPLEILTMYRVGMLAIALLSIACHLRCKRLAQAEEDSVRGTHALLIAYTSALMIVSVILTAADYAETGTFFVYVVASVLIFGLLYVQPVVTIGTTVVYTFALIIALFFLGFHDFALRMTLYAYAFIVIVVSVSNYHARTRAAMASEEVRAVARQDILTGVKNRRALMEDAAGVADVPVRMLLGDIDDFKFYNDSFGHEAGDHLLQAFADNMCAVFGADNVYRYGGDEFIAVFDGDSDEEFVQAVERWHEGFDGVEVDGEKYSPTMSGGYVSGVPTGAEDLANMLRLADIRLYDAKQAGRNTVLGAVYDSSQGSEALDDAVKLREHRTGAADELTGLPSMTYFTVHAKVLLDSPALESSPFFLVYFNIENMKIYNERFGMEMGDELIKFTARSIEESFEHALVARVGDDRFVLLTYDEDPVDGIDRVYNAVRTLNAESSTIVRAGVYPYERGVEVGTACDRAKLACDFIKGRHNVYYHYFEQGMLAARERKQLILDRFEEALEAGHVQAYYQPVVRTIGTRISEFEALARWIDPAEGFISPGDFIPVLEEFRLVHLLDLRIVESVCRDYRDAVADGFSPVPVNVNLSRYDLELCDIVGEIDVLMRRYDVPPSAINIEITESAFGESSELLNATIDRFHELGMQVWMDDFGSGYSSLNVLREFDFDVVKIDMLFLRHRDEDSKSRARTMVPHIINMCKELGIHTLIEGVEDMEQFEFLRDVGCEKVQGFAFDKPAPVAHAKELLEGKGMGVESVGESAYYNTIGQVNLSNPMAIDPELAREIELSSGLPAAIVEFRDGRVGYLQWNSSYIEYLVDIGMNTIENSTAQMNDMSRPQSQGFFKAADALRGKPDWLNLTFYEGEDLCTGMARFIAEDEASGAAAFVYIAFNLTRYLERAGMSLPKGQG